MNLHSLGRTTATALITRRKIRKTGANRKTIKSAGNYAKKLLKNGHSAARSIQLSTKLYTEKRITT